MQQRKPIPFAPERDDIPPAVRGAFRALGKGNPTPSQCATVLQFLTMDLCQILNVDDPAATERQAGITAGQRRIGIIVSDLAGVRIRIEADEEENG